MSAAPESSTCVVLGAGSWGTALAIQLARLSRPAVLWGRDPAHIAALAGVASAGIEGVVVGRALYTGAVTLADARRAAAVA